MLVDNYMCILGRINNFTKEILFGYAKPSLVLIKSVTMPLDLYTKL